MTQYYKLVTTQTSKPIGNSKQFHYEVFNTEEKHFSTISEIKNYLKDTYKDCKRTKIYQDSIPTRIPQPAHQVGWIYHFKNRDWSHNSEWWWQQDWVNVYEIHSKVVLIN